MFENLDLSTVLLLLSLTQDGVGEDNELPTLIILMSLLGEDGLGEDNNLLTLLLLSTLFKGDHKEGEGSGILPFGDGILPLLALFFLSGDGLGKGIGDIFGKGMGDGLGNLLDNPVLLILLFNLLGGGNGIGGGGSSPLLWLLLLSSGDKVGDLVSMGKKLFKSF